MIDLICKTLEKQALENNHNIGKGFYDAILAGKVPMLRMDCQDCDFFVVVDPTFGKHIQSKSGPCAGRVRLAMATNQIDQDRLKKAQADIVDKEREFLGPREG